MDLSWLKTIAPTVATALGGPLAGIAVKVIADKLGIPEATQETVVDALTNGKLTSEQLAGLKQAELELQRQENELEFKFAELEVQREKIAADDRASARMRESDTKDMTNRVLAAVIVAGFFSMAVGVLSGWADGVDSILAGTIIGYISAKADQVVSYYFGSSAGSAKKDLLLARKDAGSDGRKLVS